MRSGVTYTLGANVENLVLLGSGNIAGNGNVLANEITGNSGKNTLYGGKGADTLDGGRGADTFVYRAISDSTVSSSGRDTIDGFSLRDNDRISLRAIDTNPAKAGDQAFKFIGQADFSGKNEVRFEFKNGKTYISADLNGNEKADLSIVLDGIVRLAADDFLL